MAKTNWFYSLERTLDFSTWAAASTTNSGVNGALLLQDTDASTEAAFYRVRAWK